MFFRAPVGFDGKDPMKMAKNRTEPPILKINRPNPICSLKSLCENAIAHRKIKIKET
jgi:hypothetical protein